MIGMAASKLNGRKQFLLSMARALDRSQTLQLDVGLGEREE
jgi:hypothetical protein